MAATQALSSHSLACTRDSTGPALRRIHLERGGDFLGFGTAHKMCEQASEKPTCALKLRSQISAYKQSTSLIHPVPFPSSESKQRNPRRFTAVSSAVSAPTRSADMSADTSAETAFHVLPGGERLEVLERKAKKSTGAPVVFVHGWSRAAWCWDEHWMEYFAERGRDSYAVSLLGQGNSSVVDGPIAGTIFSHAEAVADVIKARLGEGAVLVGHSFGGLVVQAYIAKTTSGDPAFPPLVAAALLCSAPPTGNTEMMKRIFLKKPLAGLKLAWSFATKGSTRSTSLCRDTFFSPDMPDADVSRYKKLLAASSKQPLTDARALSRDVPVTRPRMGEPPVMVLAAGNDRIGDKEGWEETAAYFWTEAVVVPQIGHDVMLDVRWKDAADRLLDWLSEQEAYKST